MSSQYNCKMQPVCIHEILVRVMNTVKAVLRDRCHGRSPVLNDQIFLAEFQYN